MTNGMVASVGVKVGASRVELARGPGTLYDDPIMFPLASEGAGPG